jgi:hypothetical protein
MQYVGQTYYEDANERKLQHWYLGRKMIKYRATPKEQRLTTYAKNSRMDSCPQLNQMSQN